MRPADTGWITTLARERPESIGQLKLWTEYCRCRQESLDELVHFWAKHPELPLMRMCAEYGAALDSVALQEVQPLESKNEQTRSTRTRAGIIKAAAELAIQGSLATCSLSHVAAVAHVSLATQHKYFSTKSELIVAAYRYLASSNR